MFTLISRQCRRALPCVLVAVLVSAGTDAANTATDAALTPAGQSLKAAYQERLSALHAELLKAIPTVDGQQRAAYDKAHAAENDAEVRLAVAEQAEDAREALTAATAHTLETVAALDLATRLGRGDLDHKLATFVVMKDATPLGLALFAQQGDEQAALVAQLLDNGELMLRILTAGGARDGRYGQAMKIYSDILQVSQHPHQPGILQNLALGICLEMVVHNRQSYGTFLSRGRPAVDPVERYLYYEKAYLDGELDPSFKDMTAWECRWIASDPSSNEELTWLRTMLRNYRPDLCRDEDPRWYYTRIIKTDVAYRRPRWDTTVPVNERIQQAIDKGGICHIRAWIALSTARAFGIPARRMEQGGATSPIESSTK